MTIYDRNENLAPTIEVLYICDRKHITTVKYHAQVIDFPRTSNCRQCHEKSKYVASAATPTDEHVPDPKKLSVDLRGDSEGVEEDDHISNSGRFTSGHLQALHERRTNEELEAILQERLEWVRANKVVY